MKYRTGRELRKMFMEFWSEKGSVPTPSASLIPDDPSLLFTIAGMVPFKQYYLGLREPEHSAVHTCQKCVRTNDIENVGRTARHHTFFEMLGNFAWGNYFKLEAITWGWEFLTERIGLDGARMSASIYKDDEEAYDVWHNVVGLPDDRICRFDESGNFWYMSEKGPCGPCSEIYYDRGEKYGCGSPTCGVGCDCDRFLEIWNLVFTQFDRQADGSLIPLPKKNIDTGMGLERLSMLVQGGETNYDTDLFMPLIEHTCRQTGVKYGENPKTDMAVRVIADHVRSVALMLADGALPANDGAGYVLRRLLRRAVRYGKLLGYEKPFMCDTLPVLVNMMGDPYAELIENRQMIEQIMGVEESRFEQTLTQGTNLLDEEIRSLKTRGESVISGELAFKLYDTFGFPLELTVEMAEEQEMTVDDDKFKHEMTEQRERARRSSKQKKNALAGDVYTDVEKVYGATWFTGYTDDTGKGKVLAMFANGERVDELSEGQEGEIVLDSSPFYAEKGGQIGDSGTMIADGVEIAVSEAVIRAKDMNIHKVKVLKGQVKEGIKLLTNIDATRRSAIRRNHTATHLLHEALIRVLGGHVRQAGSLVTDEILRFDFTHFEAMTREQLSAVEDIVNREVLANTPLEISECSRDEAREKGAKALFDEKYGDVVRVVQIGGFSTELCGGLHVKATGDIGMFKILSEESVGSGARRIVAVTGMNTLRALRAMGKLLDNLMGILGSDEKSAVAKAEGMMNEVKSLHKKIDEVNRDALMKNSEGVFGKKEVGGVTLQSGKFLNQPAELLRDLGDKAKASVSPTVVVMASVANDKCSLIVMADDAAVARGAHAGKMVQAASAALGGKGGGRPTMAQGGGSAEKVDDALAAIEKTLSEQLA